MTRYARTQDRAPVKEPGCAVRNVGECGPKHLVDGAHIKTYRVRDEFVTNTAPSSER